MSWLRLIAVMENSEPFAQMQQNKMKTAEQFKNGLC